LAVEASPEEASAGSAEEDLEAVALEDLAAAAVVAEERVDSLPGQI